MLEIRQYSCVGFIQSDEKSGGAIHTQSLCGVALIQLVEKPPFGRTSDKLTPFLAAKPPKTKIGQSLALPDFKAMIEIVSP